MGDFLFNFTEWLRSTFLVDFALWISDSSLSLWIVTHFWAIPIFQVIHILSIAAGFGALLMMSLRIFGMAGGGRTIHQTTERFLPWMWWALVFLTISGLLMIVGEPVRELINPIFWFKMATIVVMLAVSIGFMNAVRTKAHAGGVDWTASAGTKTGAFVLIVLWLIIMAGGRWIAYAPV